MHREPSAALLARLDAARRETDRLFAIVEPARLFERPIAERHRLVFYIGHLEAFDRNLLSTRHFGAVSPDPELDQLFAFGIDPVGDGLPTDTPADWPSLEEIRAYAQRARHTLDRQLATVDFANDGQGVETLVNVIIEHRLMHAETLAYLLHQLPTAYKIRPPDAAASLGTSPDAARGAAEGTAQVTIPAGIAQLGIPRGRGFGWDNEIVDAAADQAPPVNQHATPPRPAPDGGPPAQPSAELVDVPAFAIDRTMVSNGEFARFVAAGGYERPEFWRAADWAWVRANGIRHPAFWLPAAGQDGAAAANPAADPVYGWRLRRMFDEIALPPDWPVYVSHAEASAYARFVGRALPSEAQWQRAVSGNAPLTANACPNADFRSWDPHPVAADDGIANSFGVLGLLGNGWEWTCTPFAPLRGFAAFPFYEGYSANFFDGQHYVMKGGSPRTAECMLRPSFRNWFQPHYPYVYAGFRCVGPLTA